MSSHLRTALAPLVLGLLATAAAAPAANGAADVAVAELRSSDALAVYGETHAWIEYGDGDRETVVLRHPDGRTQRFQDAAGARELTLGRDARGRLVLVYPSCATTRRCLLRRVDVRTGRRATVARVGGPISHPVLRRGVLAWLRGDGGDVRTRALAGGTARRQTVGRDISVTGLDHDGRRLVVTGETTLTSGQGQVDLRLVTLGSRRVRVLRSVTRGEDYRDMRSPLLSANAVDVAYAYTEETAYGMTHVSLRGRPRRITRSLGVSFTAVARGGGKLAYIDAPSSLGCGSFIDADEEEFGLVEGGCRIVRAAPDPFGAGERTIAPELLSGARVAEPGGGFRVDGRLRQRVLRAGRTTGRIPLAGRRVTILIAEDRDPGPDIDLHYPASGPQVLTDSEGRWSYSLPAAREERYVGAATVETPRTWVEQALIVPAAPGL